ncbi:MAG TPA: hypothetical protein VND64_26980 [Pirellulales bacterium]|nr:hypothetical protein [Pirellulales bacterium]
MGTDEILSELVPPERIACVTYLADDPQISNVPGFYPPGVPRLRGVDSERIIALNPDLVCVAPYNSADFLKVIERSGFSIFRNDACHSMDEIEGGILDLGNRVGETGRARVSNAPNRCASDPLVGVDPGAPGSSYGTMNHSDLGVRVSDGRKRSLRIQPHDWRTRTQAHRGQPGAI